MRFLLTIITLSLLWMAATGWMEYNLNYDYLYDRIPSCTPEEPEEEERIS